jgi:uncharacterized repeat protein (TIGR01451 family)
MALQASGQMSFADVYNEITGESLTNPPISITAAELGQLQNSQGQTIPLNQNSEFKPDGTLPTVFPTEWYKYCQICNVAKPFLTISKSAPAQGFNNQNFNFTITITNNGQASTSGIIFVTDQLQANLVYQSISGTNWSGSVANNVVALQFNGTLGIGQSTQVTIVVRTVVNATYNNYASVTGGGDSVVRFSNTTTTQVITQTWTSTQTLRLDRTFQKNDCGGFGTGTYEQIYSPFYTNTYTSFISQADADSNAYQLSFSQATTWLDVNGQNQANIQGSCVYQYPVVQLALFISPTTINRGSTGTVTLNITNQVVATSGNITIQMVLPVGTSYNGIITVPSIWSVNYTGQTLTFTTSQSLSSTYSATITFSLYANTVGAYSFRATGSGGNMLNNFTASNFINFDVIAEPSYSFSAVSENFSFNSKELNPFAETYAVPTDQAYYTGILTITNGHSGRDALRVDVIIPSFFPLNEVQVVFDSPYFSSTYSFVTSPPKVEIFNNQFNVPVGQYYFRVYLPMAIDYFRANTAGQTGLFINATGQRIFADQPTTFYFFRNNTYQSQRTILIFWASNYITGYNFNFTNTPNTTQNMQIRYRHIYQGSFTNVNMIPIGNSLSSIGWWYINPTRGARFVNSTYPLIYTIGGDQYFGMYSYILFFYNNQLIKFTTNRNDIDSSENTGIKIRSRTPDPYVRDITLTIQVDSNGNFINV